MTDEIKELVSQAVERAMAYFREGDFPNAEEMYRQILRVDPRNEKAMHVLPLAVSQNGRLGEALEAAVVAAEAYPESHQMQNNLGLMLSQLGDRGAAVSTFARAVELKPSEVFTYNNLAIEYKKIGDGESCERTFLSALEVDPNHAYTRFNYGAYLHESGQTSRAITEYLEAVRCDPEMVPAHYNLSSCYFLTKRYKEGWHQYEWRWRQFPHFAKKRDRFSFPFWCGEPLAGKSIYLYGEQGIGDVIQFVRFCRHLKESGATVHLECPAELCSLLSGMVDEVHPLVKDVSFDYHCSLMSVPLGLMKMGFDVTYRGVTGGQYLSPSGMASGWERYAGDLKIGIAWAGNPQHPNDFRRSCHLREFAALGLPGVKLFSLQKDLRKRSWPGVGEVDLTAGGECVPLVDLSEHLVDFNSTALAISQMDLVVCVDCVIAHLAGAMGKPVVVLLPSACDWRWALEDDRTPWYDSVRIIPWQGSWSAGFGRVLKLIASESIQTPKGV